MPVSVGGATRVFRGRFPGVGGARIILRCNAPVCPGRLSGSMGGRVKDCIRGVVSRAVRGGTTLVGG